MSAAKAIGTRAASRDNTNQSPDRARHPERAGGTDARSAVSERVGAGPYQRYFDGQARPEFVNGRLEIVVPSDSVAKALERRFGKHLREAAGGLGHNGSVGEFVFRVDRSRFASAPSPAPTRATPITHAAPARPPAVPTRLKLADFVVGTSNRLAYSAAVRAAEDPAFRGCLFIHGVCGLGKTHLLQGIAERYAELRPDAQVRYITAEAFTNAYIAAMKANKIDSFRKQFRKLDLLCLDDVHFFSNKEATQTELLHTFDAIGNVGSRVVLASDEHPREIARLNSHLTSRFLAGTVVRIETPDPELREKLVRHLGLRRGLVLEDAAVRLLAERSARSVGTLGGFGGSVREIDGLLLQVEAVQRLLPEFAAGSGTTGVVLVRKALGLAEGERPAGPRVRRPIAIETVVGEVCRCLTVDHGEFVGKGRHKRVVLARAVCGHLSRRLTTLSFPEIARGMGRPNHSTIITACKRLAEQIRDGENPLGEDDVSAGIIHELRGLNLQNLIEAIGDRIARTAG